MNYARGATLIALLALTGCAGRRTPSPYRTVIRANCLTGPVVLQNCISTAGPPHCQVILKYRPSCAEIQVKSHGASTEDQNSRAAK